MLTRRYEGTCRFFRSLRPPPPPPEILAEQYLQQSKQRHHESLIDEAESELSQLKAWELMTAGGLAGVVAWIATFPVDVFKTRMQGTSWEGVAGASGSTAGACDGKLRVGEVQVRRKRMPSLWSTGRGAVQKEGWRVMFAGLGPTLVRAVPVSAIDLPAVRPSQIDLVQTGRRRICLGVTADGQVNMVVFFSFEACVAALSGR